MAIEIDTIEEMDATRALLGESYLQMRDLDFEDDDCYDNPANKAGYTTGLGWLPIGATADGSGVITGSAQFVGTYDGGGHVIRHLYSRRGSTESHHGPGWMMFGTNGTVRDLGFLDPRVVYLDAAGNTANRAAGVISPGASAGPGTIQRVFVRRASVEWEGTPISGSTRALSPFLARVRVGAIEDCYSEDNAFVINDPARFRRGGIAAWEQFSGDVDVARVYSANAGVTPLGDFTDAGWASSDCLFDSTLAGTTTDPGGFEAKTSAEMKDIATYLAAGWDIVPMEQHDGTLGAGVWWIDDGEDYPRLWFEREPVPAIQGQLTDQDGSPVGDADVYLLTYDSLTETLEQVAYTQSDAGGGYTFTEPPGAPPYVVVGRKLGSPNIMRVSDFNLVPE